MGTKTYQAAERLYISSEGRMIEGGETFTVDDSIKPGKAWLNEDGTPIEEKKAKKTAKAPAETDYTKLSLEELTKLAADRKIATDGLDAAGLAAALTAADADG